jgi:ATP-binding cassette subfamily G (WHITE) protein 2 (PDR)
MVIFNHRVFLAGEYVTAEKSKPEIESRLPPRIRPWTCQLSRQDVEGLPSGPVTDLLENPDNGNNSSREVGIFSSWQMVYIRPCSSRMSVSSLER